MNCDKCNGKNLVYLFKLKDLNNTVFSLKCISCQIDEIEINYQPNSIVNSKELCIVCNKRISKKVVDLCKTTDNSNKGIYEIIIKCNNCFKKSKNVEKIVRSKSLDNLNSSDSELSNLDSSLSNYQ